MRQWSGTENIRYCVTDSGAGLKTQGIVTMAKSKPEFAISLVALVLSIIATISSIYFSNVNLKTNVLPTLVFVYDSIRGWSIHNVGNGPALNVVVAHQNHGEDKWKAPTRLYPIAKDEIIPVEWVGRNPDKLMAAYTDVHNRKHSSLTDEDMTTISDKDASKSWREAEIRRSWERR